MGHDGRRWNPWPGAPGCGRQVVSIWANGGASPTATTGRMKRRRDALPALVVSRTGSRPVPTSTNCPQLLPLDCLPDRFEAGAKEYDLPIVAQVPILFATLGFLETKRLQGWKETGTVSRLPILELCAC